MNNKVFIAKLNWLKSSEGGRKSPIPMNMEKYCPIVSVEGQRTFSGSDFGLLCNSFERIGEFNTLAYVRYLNVKDAPDNLYIGSHIALYEGAKLVATGQIIEASDFQFSID